MIAGNINTGNSALTQVDHQVRQAITLNHSATHLMHAALRRILGDHVTQKGSLVDSEKLRFDFTHTATVSEDELCQVACRVNREIRRNTPVYTELCNMQQAKEKGAMMLFGEKYGDEVRVLSMGDNFSVELCGGTHVKRTGDIGLFHIVSESGIAAGIRRIEAITGEKALAYFTSLEARGKKIAQQLKVTPDNTVDKITQLSLQLKEQEKTLAALQSKLANVNSSDLLQYVQKTAGINILAHRIDGIKAKTLRELADSLKNRMESGIFLLASAEGDNVSLLAGVTRDLVPHFKANELMREVAPLVKGKGGGRPEMAQGGGSDPSGITNVLEKTVQWVQNQSVSD